MDARGERVAEVRAEVQRALQRGSCSSASRAAVWSDGRLQQLGTAEARPGHEGRITTLWPGSTLEFRRRTRRFAAADYAFGAR